MTPKLKKIIITLIIILILFVVYAVFIKKDPTAESMIGGTGSVSSDAQVLGSQISQALVRIEQIKLDRGIFDNNIYKTLTDRSEIIEEEPIGRSNPFAPIGDVSVSSSVRSNTIASTTKPQATSTPSTNAASN